MFGKVGRAFWEKVEERAGGRKAIVSALRDAGRDISVQSVGAWIRGENEPQFAIYCWASDRFGVSIDDLVAETLDGSRVPAALAAKVAQIEATQAHIMAWLMHKDPEFAESLIRPEPEQAERGA